MPGRAALHRTHPDPAHPHGQRTRLGISFIYAAQTWRQLAALYGEQEARALLGLTNVLVMFGGSKDVTFNREMSDLLGNVRVPRTSWQHGRQGGRTTSGEDIPIISQGEIRQIPAQQALVVPENGAPIIAHLDRSIAGRDGARLLADQAALRARVRASAEVLTPDARRAAVLANARRHHLIDLE